MAKYGKLQGTVQLANGNADSGAVVEIRRAGAFVTSTQAGPTYTVNDSGAILTSDQVRANTTLSPTRNVSSVTATTVVTSGTGLGTLNNNDRITVQSPLPTLSADAQGSESKANPLSTNASGYWFCWVPITAYDILITKSDGSGTVLKTDVWPEGSEYNINYTFPGASAVALYHQTQRNMTSGDLLKIDNTTSEKMALDWEGNLTLAGDLAVVDIAASGNVAITGDLTVDDITMDDLTADDISVGDLTVSGAVSLPAGSLETADLAANAVTGSTISTGTTDQTFAFGSGFTAVVGDGPGSVVAVTITPFSTASVFEITAYVPCQSAGAAASHLFARIRHSGSTLHEAGCVTSAGAGDPGNISLMARQTGLSGAQTWSLECDANVADMSVLSSSTSRKAKLMVKELKK